MRMTAIMMTKKINTLLIEMNISKKELARRLNTSPSNLSGKLKRDNFTEKELQSSRGISTDYIANLAPDFS